MFASSSRGGPAPAGRGAAGGGGGKFSVDELYGLPKKGKMTRGESTRRRSQVAQGAQVGRDGQTLTPAQVLEAARHLLEQRRLESYLLEAGITAEELESNRTCMVYREYTPAMYPYKPHGTDAFGTPLRRTPPKTGKEAPKRKSQAPLQSQIHTPETGLDVFLTSHGIDLFPDPSIRCRSKPSSFPRKRHTICGRYCHHRLSRSQQWPTPRRC